MSSEREITTLADAIAYLKPDASNRDTISLRAVKAWQAVEVIEAEIAALRAKDREDGAPLGLGQRVRKVTGDYRIDGIVVGHAVMSTGARRYVVEHKAEGGGAFLHIYAESNLVALPLQRTEDGDA